MLSIFTFPLFNLILMEVPGRYELQLIEEKMIKALWRNNPAETQLAVL